MSTITDAIKKRKKEAGEEEVKEFVPASLDEPEVEVPKEGRARRIFAVAIVLLLVGAVTVGAVMLFGELRREKAAADAGSQLASLSKPGGEGLGASKGVDDTLPLTGSPSKSGDTNSGTAPGAPNEPLPQPSTQDRSPGLWEESPSETGPGLAPEVATASPNALQVIPPDPFAGIKLQGIVRFDPDAPEALINGKTLKVGDSFDGIEVVEIGADSVRLRSGDIEKVINYR